MSAYNSRLSEDAREIAGARIAALIEKAENWGGIRAPISKTEIEALSATILQNVLEEFCPEAFEQDAYPAGTPTDEATIAKAIERYATEGAIEVDADAVVARGTTNADRGAYVGAWLWVPDKD